MRKYIIAGIFLLFGTSSHVYAQWTTSGSNIYNSNSGNVGIGTTNPNTTLDVAGTTLNSTANVNYYHNVVSYSGSSSITGTMEITLPNGWTNTMMTMVIKGYNYSAASGWEVHVSGYNYTNTPAWYNYKAEIIGSAPFSEIRLAYNTATNKNVVLLGTTNTIWLNPKIGVTEFTAGYLNISGWGSGWAIAPITSESTITNSVTPKLATYLTTDGNFGIGTSSPQAKLDVNGKVFIGVSDANTATQIAPYSLAVDGSAIFIKAVVKLKTNWPDYVFNPDYKLPKLDSLEQFLKTKGHLPGIPTTEEVKKNGIDLGSNQAQLLKKIEELTLIVIEQNKRLEKLEQEIKKNN